MRIKEIISQNRRDFTALYECESCEYKENGSGYDDDYFHQTVIPQMICKQCGAVAPENYRGLSPKYPAGMEV